MKKISILSLSVILGVTLAASAALADSANLYLTPASGSHTVGASFTSSVAVNPVGNKACVVKGTLSFTNLSCTGISVASGLVAQTSPTCASPNFTIGIPQCATDIKNILSVSVKGVASGSASVALSNVRVIGVGVNVPSTSAGANYTITKAAAASTTTTTTTTVTPDQTTPDTTTQAAVDTSVVPTGAQSTASVSSGLSSLLNSPIFVVILIIILILIILWFADRMIKHKKKQ